MYTRWKFGRGSVRERLFRKVRLDHRLVVLLDGLEDASDGTDTIDGGIGGGEGYIQIRIEEFLTQQACYEMNIIATTTPDGYTEERFSWFTKLNVSKRPTPTATRSSFSWLNRLSLSPSISLSPFLPFSLSICLFLFLSISLFPSFSLPLHFSLMSPSHPYTFVRVQMYVRGLL